MFDACLFQQPAGMSGSKQELRFLLHQPRPPADLATLVTQCCSAGRLQGALCCSSILARPPPRASCRSDATFSGRPSYGNVYAAVNAMAGHLNSFGPTAPVPKKRLERMIKVGRVDEPLWLC